MKRFPLFLLTLSLALMGLAILPSCQQSMVFPSVTPTATGQYTPGAFVWRDLITKDPAAAQRFYGEVFGWTFETMSNKAFSYTVIKNNGKAIGGIFPLPSGAAATSSAEWVSAMSVPSVQGAVDLLVSRGGKLIDRVQEISGRGTSAWVMDPEGAIFGLVRSPIGDPAAQAPVDNGWLWTELWANQPLKALTFYKNFAGYETERTEDDDRTYWLLKKDGTERAGLIENPAEDMRSYWMPYIKVADPVAVTAKAKAAGAQVMVSPSPTLRNNGVAILIDPTGAPFVIQKWPL